MPRTLSGTSLSALLAQQTDEPFIVLLTIVGIENTWYLTNNSVDTIVPAGETYLQMPFDIILPDNVDGKSPQSTLSIDNVSRMLIDELRTYQTPLVVTIQVVRAKDPTDVLASWENFKMRQVSYNAMTVQGQLSRDIFINELVGIIMTGGIFNGLFYR